MHADVQFDGHLYTTSLACTNTQMQRVEGVLTATTCVESCRAPAVSHQRAGCCPDVCTAPIRACGCVHAKARSQPKAWCKCRYHAPRSVHCVQQAVQPRMCTERSRDMCAGMRIDTRTSMPTQSICSSKSINAPVPAHLLVHVSIFVSLCCWAHVHL